MNRLILSLALLVWTAAARADLQAPVRTLQAVLDPANIVMDRGSKLEIYPAQRAIPQADYSGRVVAHHVTRAMAGSAINPSRLGVVFNHAMQQQGYISGEIAFKMKPGSTVTGFSSSLYPGLKRITNPDVYVVTGRTPAEFLQLLKRLQLRNDLEWVEPTVTYAGSSHGPSTH